MLGIAFLASVFSSLFILGIIAYTKAKTSGRKGAGIFQPLHDIVRLFRKGSVYSTTTSLVFQLAPVVYFSTILVALGFLPFGTNAGLLSFEGDFVFFSYLLALGKFMLILNAMDTGSGFEGMGANREALYSMLVEPAFFILMGSLALFTQHTSFQALFAEVQIGEHLSYLLAVLGIYILVQIAMVENSRLPVDDPRTHLELTMVHEVMVLDNSGFDLGLIQTGTALKFSLYGALIANFLMPTAAPIWANLLIFFGVQLGFGVLVGMLESFRARNKIARNPQFILTLSAIALLVFFTVLIITHKFAA